MRATVLLTLLGCSRGEGGKGTEAPVAGQAAEREGQGVPGQAGRVRDDSSPADPPPPSVGSDPSSAELAGWVKTPDLAALRAAAAAAADKPIAVELSAEWCLPCKELAIVTLANDAVVARLVGVTKVTIDVTDGTDAQTDIQARLGAETLPHLVIYRSGAALTGVLADEPKAADPVLRLRTFVEPAALLEELDAAGL